MPIGTIRARLSRAIPLAARTLIALAAASLVVNAGCSNEKRTPERAAVIERDIPSPLRGTVGSMCTFRGVEPQLVSGFGIVVGLNGTGGGYIDPGVRQTMERELARGGINKGIAKPGDIGVTPDQFLRDPNIAVVIVEAAIPPGAPSGSLFDVRVRALPNSGVTSLEGGRLWTTELRIGPATVMTGVRTRIIAEANGAIFINPFAEPGANGQDAVNRTAGRILNGGKVTHPLKIELVLDNDSHTRARAIVAAINTRFPEGRGDVGSTATGRSGSSIAVQVPRAYRDRASEFLGLLRHLNIDQSFPQELARKYVEDMKASPDLSEDLGWCLRAIGAPAIPFLKDLYDYPQMTPRLAALEAGAKLGDIRVLPHLRRLAEDGPSTVRVPAIQLMGGLPANADVSETLRALVDSPVLDIRVAAYEAMVERNDPYIDRIIVADDPHFLKFYVDMVPAKDPLIYITQQGEPRIVLFGGTGEGFGTRRDSISLSKPLLVSAWGDRLMLNADEADSPVRVYYLNEQTGKRVLENTVPEQVAALLHYMAHTPSPEDPSPGLGFTYSEVVGALYEVYRQQGVAALFATEQDRLRASVYEAARTNIIEERPEVSTPEETVVTTFEPLKPTVPTTSAAVENEPRSLVVPLPRRTPK